MKFVETELPGVWLIEAEPFADERGVFRRHFCEREFKADGLDFNVRQGNISENPHRGTLRGFHYQAKPFEESKILSCLTGGLYDIVVDLRPESRSFMKWIATELTAANRRSLYVPAGCANAWLTIETDTLVHYYMSEFYNAESYRGLRYDDPAFQFRWPSQPQFMSDKDRMFADFDPKNFDPNGFDPKSVQ
jgi:dTDP-4-dehydrorhamnose 3,5-epimerase